MRGIELFIEKQVVVVGWTTDKGFHSIDEMLFVQMMTFGELHLFLGLIMHFQIRRRQQRKRGIIGSSLAATLINTHFLIYSKCSESLLHCIFDDFRRFRSFVINRIFEFTSNDKSKLADSFKSLRTTTIKSCTWKFARFIVLTFHTSISYLYWPTD